MGGNDEGAGVNIHYPNIDDYGVWAEHDYACPVCVSRKAVYVMNEGRFLPCDLCAADGWVIVQRRDRWGAITRLFGR